MADAATKVEPNVFLSWSLTRSGAVAGALHTWLKRVVQQCRPWMSDRDIYTGKRWRAEIAQHLASIRVGVLCLTPENVERPWINFEAGALSRAVGDDARVCVYCFDLKPTDFADPLGDFNGVEATKDGTLRLVRSINAAMEQPVAEADLEAVFSALWPELESALAKVPPSAHAKGPARPTGEMLEEILTRVRSLERGATPAPQISSADRKELLIAAFQKAALRSLEETAMQIARGERTDFRGLLETYIEATPAGPLQEELRTRGLEMLANATAARRTRNRTD